MAAWGAVLALSSTPDRADCADFVFMNSSVRGPMLPWYSQGTQHWTALFTRKLSAKVKLVGPSISCEHFCLLMTDDAGAPTRYCRKNAHVQSVAVATDTVRALA